MEQTTHSNTIWYVVGAIVIIALATWYFSSPKSPAGSTQPTAVEQTQPAQSPTVSSGNTTAAISAELNQTSDGTAELNQAAAASAQAVQSF